MARDENGFTPTQARIVNVLIDGTWHPKRELLYAVDELADDDNLLQYHLKNIKRILKPRNEHITFQIHPTMGTLYMLTRALSPSNIG